MLLALSITSPLWVCPPWLRSIVSASFLPIGILNYHVQLNLVCLDDQAECVSVLLCDYQILHSHHVHLTNCDLGQSYVCLILLKLLNKQTSLVSLA